MKKIFYLIALLVFFSGCTKEVESYLEVSPIRPEIPGSTSASIPNYKTPPYKIPEVKTANAFKNKVYFDPGYKGGGSDGTINKPYTDFNKQYLNGIPSNTAFLFKRGTAHPKIGRQVGGRNSFYPKMLYNNNLIGSYGEGKRPVIEGFFIMAGSHHLTIRDLDIKAESQAGGYDAVVYIHRTREGGYTYSSNITIAHSEIAGVHNPGNYYDPTPYPFFGIRFFCENFTIYNSIIRDTWQHGIIAERGTGFKAVRNWIYDVVHQDQRAQDEGWPTRNSNDPWSYKHGNNTSKAGWGNSIFVSTYVNTTNHYVAGNLMDRSRYRWKAAYITGAEWGAPYSNLILEYNTFIAPKASEAGGVAVNWGAPKGSIFRKNVIDCSNGGTGETQFALAGRSPEGRLKDHVTQNHPYGIYDNHMIRPHAGFSLTGSDSDEISVKNKLFDSWSEYQTFLKTNEPVGSDIDPNDFWQGRY